MNEYSVQASKCDAGTSPRGEVRALPWLEKIIEDQPRHRKISSNLIMTTDIHPGLSFIVLTMTCVDSITH